jgi:hypothetical protein
MQRKIAHCETHPELLRYDYYHGVPQGNPISPILSTLPITRHLLNRTDTHVVQFADDGILYDYETSPTAILQFPPESGILVNYSKSGVIRYGGV